MKYSIKTLCKFLSLISIVLIFMNSCSKDDSADLNPESIVQPIKLDGNLILTGSDESINIDLSNGSLLQETAVSSTGNIKEYNGAYYDFQSNTIKKTSDLEGTILWEKEYLNEIERSYRIEEAESAFSETTLFVAYQILHNTTYQSQYFLEALDISDGNSLWKQEVEGFTVPYFYENRLITTTYPNANANVIIQYRNKQLGDIIAEQTIDERINEFIFDGDLIYAASWNNRVLTLDRELNIEWSFETDGANPGIPIVLGNQFIFFSRDKYLYSLNKNTGALNWKTEMTDTSILGLGAFGNKVYISEQLTEYTLTTSVINTADGSIEKIFDKPMSESYYSTRLKFYKDYLLLITSPSSDEYDNQIKVELVYLPSTETLWSTLINMPLNNLNITITL